jgi:hypothetical protein
MKCSGKTRLARLCDRPLDRPRKWSDTQWASFASAQAKRCSPKETRCPLRRLELDCPDVVGWISDARLVETTGALLVQGGILDQPAKWLEAVRLVMAENNAITIELMEAKR